jgi:pseudaminic acid cytidylyltransferase
MKNIRPFFGAPIMGHVIENVRRSGVIESIIVTTDHPEIRSVALDCGALVPFVRDDSTSNDIATLHDVVVEVLERSPVAQEAEHVLCVLPTAALIEPSTYSDATATYLGSTCDSLMTLVQYPHPIERALRIDAGGYIVMASPSEARTRTQDAPPAYFDAGQLYLARSRGVVSRRTLRGPACIGYILDSAECQDIDTEADWAMAELKYDLRRIRRTRR